jgi:hypothetical protein
MEPPVFSGSISPESYTIFGELEKEFPSLPQSNVLPSLA